MTTSAPPTTSSDARDVVDALIDDGLPSPRTVSVRRYSDEEVSLSLTLFDTADLAAWGERLDSGSAVDPGPWPIAARDYEVRVGRLSGLLTVLAAEQDTDPTAGA